MPKSIKKRIAKPSQAGQDDMMDFLGRLRETAATRQRQVVTAVAAVVGIIIVVAFIYYYQAGTARKARQLEAQAYQAYAGLNDYSGLNAQDKAQKALELFTKAYEARKTPYALLYMANSQYVLGDYQAAADTADRLIKEFPGNQTFVPAAIMKKAAALLAAGEKDKALEAFDALSKKEGAPLADAALYEAGTTLDEMGREDEAKAKFEDLVKKYPDSPYANQALQKIGLGPEGKELKVTQKPGENTGESASQGAKAPAGGLAPSDLGIK